ncbi:hypothetical protein SERLA73DRAFT_57800 [Serpula lacrymans var. lacrymans S7.3]|uniref:Conserved oligomeric Golgi complex subunit 3 n=1 Tax=Serpula lacrymans var. lacrymans (strain S7.3) TaxID=936435 RepID=F8Q2H0_SERL3|nr:hypothetical protein SERLA73DRAFT_57800 [Serpula lacrymans var. lacrymans S7.3]
MSSSRLPAGQRRGAPPSALTPHPKPTLTMEQWEAKAPLGDLSLKSVAGVKLASETIPLPLKVRRSSVSGCRNSSRPSTPNLRNKLGSGSRPSTPNQFIGRPLATHALHPKQPIQTPEQFYDWFAQIDRSVAHNQEAHFRAHVADISEHLATCDFLLERIDEIDREVDEMLSNWRSVEEGGKSLKDACEKLLEERDQLLEMMEEIGQVLEYFNELEQATRMLNHPGESLVLKTDFLYMVERVDICIEYLNSHRYFKEAEIYLLRFQQCMTRAMTLIKMYFVGSLRALTGDVSKRLFAKDVSLTAQMHLLYTRFRSITPQLAPLLGELERRAQVHPEDLSALLSECHTAYFSARKSLLVGRLTEEIKGLDPARTELVELTRTGCSYLKQLCTDEFDLYRELFNSGEVQLYHYLENLCDYLYDDLRPRILHETRLTALCEVCTVLQALVVLDVADLPDSPLDTNDLDYSGESLTLDLDHPPNRPQGLGKLHISQLLQMVLQDAQTRLFFKAQSVIQSEIRYYVPTPEDLAYPEKLVAARKPRSEIEIKEKESVNQLFRLPSLDKQETWFPTLRKTVWVLSQLHDFVKPAIFEDIAQEAISLCRQSFVSPSQNICARNPPSSTLDGELFLVRHLLILKDMTQTLDFGQRNSGPSIDFETLALILNKTSSLLPDALFASLGMPRGGDGITDDIDQDLKQACRDVISRCVEPICEPLREWVMRVRVHTTTRNEHPNLDKAPTSLVTQTWAQQHAAEDLHEKFILSCERDLRSSVMRMRLYLEDDRTVSVLVGHIKEAIMEDYMAFRDLVWNMYAGAMKSTVLSAERLEETLRTICTDD